MTISEPASPVLSLSVNGAHLRQVKLADHAEVIAISGAGQPSWERYS